MRYNVALFTLTSLIPFVASTYVKPGPSSCKKTEFWWKDKSCCLPHGGIPNPPPPPKGNYCPPTSYYWSKQQGCCVPQHAPPDHGPQPQCPKDSIWYPALYKCLPLPKPTPTHTPPKPSAKPTEPCDNKGKGGKYGDGKCEDGHDHDGKDHGKGYGDKDGKDYGKGHDDNDGKYYGKDHDQKDGKDYGKGDKDGKDYGGKGLNWHRRRSVRAYRPRHCPSGLEACPIPGLSNGEYECLDTLVELESCGGCASTNKGQNCNAIKDAWNVGCEEGRCVVYTCAGGFRPSSDMQSCIPL